MEDMENYMKCYFPTCKNDSKNSSKTIVRIREDLRERWCREANVEYYQCFTQYCCEDHFDPEQALTNINFKAEKKQPKFKPTAKLRNVGAALQEEVSSGLQPDESELAKLLLLSEPEPKKRKCDQLNSPSMSGVISSHPFKVQVAVQAVVTMVDKSTNTIYGS